VNSKGCGKTTWPASLTSMMPFNAGNETCSFGLGKLYQIALAAVFMVCVASATDWRPRLRMFFCAEMHSLRMMCLWGLSRSKRSAMDYQSTALCASCTCRINAGCATSHVGRGRRCLASQDQPDKDWRVVAQAERLVGIWLPCRTCRAT
jgi:hypothetical protein